MENFAESIRRQGSAHRKASYRHEASTRTRIVFAHRSCRFHSGCFCSNIHYDDIVVKKMRRSVDPEGTTVRPL